MNENNFYTISSKLVLPYLETDRDYIDKIFRVLEQDFGLKKGAKQKLIDLGSGDGRVVIHAALKYKIRSVGIELDDHFFQLSQQKIKEFKNSSKIPRKLVRKMEFKKADLFKQDLSKYNFIYIYSYPPMHAFLNHVLRTAKKRAIVISFRYELNSFFESLEFKQELTLASGKNSLSAFFYARI